MKPVTSLPEIVPARYEDAALIGGLIASAFHGLDTMRRRIGDPDLRRALLPGLFTACAEHAFEYGSVEVTEDLSAVALWVAETGQDKPAPTAPKGCLAAALGAWTESVHSFELALHEAEPTGTQFEKLTALAVLPSRQGEGLGTSLLAHHLASLDQRLIPSYLVASSASTRGYYRSFGFDEAGLAPIKLCDGVRMHPMWREPSGLGRSDRLPRS